MTVQELFDTIKIETEYNLLCDNLTPILSGKKKDNFNRQVLRVYTGDETLKIVTDKTVDDEETDRAYALCRNSAEKLRDMCSKISECKNCRFLANNRCMIDGTPEQWKIEED